MTSALCIPRVTAGLAACTPVARAAAGRVAEAAASALSSAVGHPVRFHGTACPGSWAAAAATTRLPFALAGVPGHCTLEVDTRFAARAVDLLAGGDGAVNGALALTPVESAALELLALFALDGALLVPELAALAPRLSRDDVLQERGTLVVELAIELGTVRGSARLGVPPAAVAALGRSGETADPAPAIPDWTLDVGFHSGEARLTAPELEALSPGDVLLLDPADDELVLPGGFAIGGRLEQDHFTVHGARMNEWTGTFPITLSVELARVQVSLSALARLEPGGVLPLQVGRDGIVVLRAGERAVARGQLVDVEGVLGVRVDALEPQP